MKKILATLLLCGIIHAEITHDPRSAGNSLARNTSGVSYEALYHNPALLGINKPPYGGLLIMPITNYGGGYWSNKLVKISPIKNMTKFGKPEELADILENSFKYSFDVDGLDTTGWGTKYASDSIRQAKKDEHYDNISKQLTEELKGGIKVYSGAKLSWFSLSHKRFGFDVSTRLDEEIHIPEGPLYFIFSGNENGLVNGKSLSFEDFSQNLLLRTDISFALGLPVSIPVLHNLFKLNRGAGGFGVKYILGHSILNAKANSGVLSLDSASNGYNVDGEVEIQTAGLGMHGNFQFEDGAPPILPVNGHGIGVDIGGTLYDDKGSMTINFQNVGVIFWVNDVKEATYKIKKDSFDLYDIIRGIEDAKDYEDRTGEEADENLYIFNRNAKEYISDASDSLDDASGFVSVLPVNINIGYSRIWDYSRNARRGIEKACDYLYVGTNYQQQVTPGPGRSYIPRFSLGSEAGLFKSFFPFRMGFILGGPERFASSLGASLNFRYFSLHGSYKSIGSLLFYPRRGLELAAGASLNWGMESDTDGDGIVDKKDKCPYEPEDVDGFEDKDGCPDTDNDMDGIIDLADRCPNEPEDLDEFEDKDGCPEPDNDHDGVPDSTDICRDEPEDRDGYDDQDGCPDIDNDSDLIPDSLDKCPNDAEDIDEFEDKDGCPDHDNDKDGIPDSTDKCPKEKEVYNGFQDDDGCPDEAKKPTKKEEKEFNKKLQGINFKSGSAELTTSSYNTLNYVVNFLNQYGQLKYEIQGHTDSQGKDEYNLLLSAARANSVRYYLINKGIAADRLIAIGYGEKRPIASNRNSKGRAMNRRVEFYIIGTEKAYKDLKRQEAIFMEKIRNAKIKGFEYQD